MKRTAIIATVVIATLLTGGWFFRRVPAAPKDALYALSRAGADVTVRRVPAAAIDAADRAAAEFRDAGWSEAPVSVRTFHLLTRGDDVAAMVAEDVPSGGSRLTTIIKHRALR